MSKSDVETATEPLFPTMVENPELRWAFIRKIYSILTIQLLLTIIVATIIFNVHPITYFFLATTQGLVLFIIIAITPAVMILLLYCFREKHPLNYFLLCLFTLSMACLIGIGCAFDSGRVVLEAVILTFVVTVLLTVYTFWAAKRGHEHNFLTGFLICGFIVLLVFVIIQIFFPLGKLFQMIMGVVISIAYCAFIIYDTDNLIKRYSYDDYIWASVTLYLDIFNLFLWIVRIFGRQ